MPVLLLLPHRHSFSAHRWSSSPPVQELADLEALPEELTVLGDKKRLAHVEGKLTSS
jgi:hypothetical protein